MITMQKAALYTAGAFFAVGAAVHAVRLMTGLEIVVGEVAIPLWLSFPGILAAAGLATWMVVAAQRS